MLNLGAGLFIDEDGFAHPVVVAGSCDRWFTIELSEYETATSH